MKYAIIKCTDGNYAVHGEYPTLNAARIAFHQFCAALWNDPGTEKAMIMIADDNLDAVEGIKEFIHIEQEQTE